MPLTLNLYCTPQDVYDLLSSEMAQSLLDDHYSASGQKVVLLQAADANATSLTIAPLQWALLAGTVLTFDGGGLVEALDLTVATTTPRGQTTLAIVPQETPLPAGAYAVDTGNNLALAARLLKACQYGTTQVKLYCSSRYEDSDLQLNAGEHGSVNRWSSSLGARWLCSRRGNSPPKAVADLAAEALDELKLVKTGMIQIEDIGTRTAGWPFITNVTLDVGYDYRKLRVESPLSEGTPVQYPQAVDWNSALWYEL